MERRWYLGRVDPPRRYGFAAVLTSESRCDGGDDPAKSQAPYCVCMFSFRQHVKMSGYGHLPWPVHCRTLHEGEHRVELVAVGNTLIQESDGLVLQGRGYPNRDSALAAGVRWRSILMRLLAGLNLSADFALRETNGGGLTKETLEQMNQRLTSGVILNDHSTLFVYEGDPDETHFFNMSLSASMLPNEERCEAILRAATATAELCDETTYELYAASDHGSAEARLLLLVSALERHASLSSEGTERRDSPEVAEFVKYAIREASKCGLFESEDPEMARHLRADLNRLRSRLGSLKRGDPSPRSVIAELVHSDPRYATALAPECGWTEVIDSAFKLRHRILHGDPLPDLQSVTATTGTLRTLVAMLVAGPEAVALGETTNQNC